MKTFRTIPPRKRGFIPPTQEEMKAVADQVGLKTYSPVLVTDLLNLEAGGEITPPSYYRDLVREYALEKTLKNPLKLKNLESEVDEETEKVMRYHSRVQEFVSEIDLSHFPGNTPLEQAMALLKLLSGLKAKGYGASDNEDSIPIFTDGNPGQIQDQLEQILGDVESLSDAELDMIDPNGDGHELEQDEKKEHDGQRSGTQGLKSLKIAEKLLPGTEEKKILEIARTLNKFTKLDVRRQKKTVADPTSDKVRRRPIAHLGELPKLPANELAKYGYLPRPYFNYLALTGGLQVRERYTHEEKKQAILILLDGSGSMAGEKHTKATGVVMNRLLAVVEGDAEVYLGVFDTQLKIIGEAKTPAAARELIKKFRAKNFKGGGTNIAAAVKEGHALIEQKIKDGEALWRPEIVILTDEDTSSEGVTAADVSGTRVHGFAMGVKNPGLVRFAESTDGLGIENF